MTGPSVIVLPDVRQHKLCARIVESSFPNVVAVDDCTGGEVPARKTLADDHHVRAHAVQFHAEPVPCFREKHDYVRHHENPVFLTDLIRKREEIAVHVDCATFALNGLEDKGGDGLSTFMQNTFF